MSNIMNEYDNLDFRLNLLYDATYGNKTSQYSIHPIIRNNITLLDIKTPIFYDYSHVFNEDINFIGKYNGKYIFKRKSKTSYPCNLTIGVYKNQINVNNLQHRDLYNPLMHYVLSEICIVEKLKHVILPILFFDITLDDVKKHSEEIYEKIKTEASNNEIYVYITERYFKMNTLKEYIKEEYKNMTIEHWKVIIFQVFYTLYKIYESVDGFRHNMLNLESVRLYRKEKNDSYEPYKIGDIIFNIPNIGVEIKLTDFNYSNAKFMTNKDAPHTEDNPYYDIHYFMSSLYIYLKKEHLEIPNELNEFINEMIPNIFLPEINKKFEGLNEEQFNKMSSKILIPSNVLKKNNFFSEFIVMNVSSSNVLNKNIQIDELNYKEDGVNYLSPTDDSSEKPRLLARNFPKQYYNKHKKMVKGIKKSVGSKFSENDITSNNIFEKAEKRTSRRTSGGRRRERIFEKHSDKKQMKGVSDSDEEKYTIDNVSLADSSFDEPKSSNGRAASISSKQEKNNFLSIGNAASV